MTQSSQPAGMSAEQLRLKTLRVKVHPSSWAWLNAAALETNLVWNHVNELCHKAAKPYYGRGKRLAAFDVDRLLAGTAKYLRYLPQHSIAQLTHEHASKRQTVRRSRLAWRTSSGPRRSLGWVPFRNGQMKFRDGAIRFAGRRFEYQLVVDLKQHARFPAL